jgi:hypothetical protein
VRIIAAEFANALLLWQRCGNKIAWFVAGFMFENRSAAVTSLSSSRALGVELPKKQRARRTNDPFSEFDTNTSRGRRLADLTRAYLVALGNPPEIERQAEVIAAAELQVLAEEARALALKQVGHSDLDQVIRLQGAADRAVRKLGLDRSREAAPAKAISLDEYLAATEAAAEVDRTTDHRNGAAGYTDEEAR